ncbi:MAG TPA: sugar ABC transporter permease [Candidatus Methylomirabilis sp.]|nr:sugar ABC transporter permease [Candidatus Methylomirabilis sp.]HSC72107.1 sugar ABC transporter permease [Candidatus Methylomirabilis sp.]
MASPDGVGSTSSVALGAGVTVQAPARRGAGSLQALRRSQLAFLLWIFAPVVSLFIIIRVIPIFVILIFSFTNYSITRAFWRWTGLINFERLLQDNNFLLALWNSTEYVLVAVPAEIGLGLLFAVLLSRRVRFESFYETLYFLPYIIPMVPAAIIWKWIYAPGSVGLANFYLEMLGFGRVGWLTNPNIALLAVIGMHVWKNLGFFVIIFLVGLKNVPADVKEAAAIDGASEWVKVWRVELPLLKPIILFGAVMATIWAWSAFTEVYIMTQGTDISTGTEIAVLVFRIYQEGFRFYNMGYASAISFVLFILSLVFVLIQFQLFRGWKEDGA